MRRRQILASLAATCAVRGLPALAAQGLASPLDRLVPSPSSRLVTGLAMSGGDGSKIDLAAFRGKTVILNLWGSWCFPCREELPGLARLADLLEGLPFAVLPLAIERHGAEAVNRFYRETSITNLPVLLGDGQNIASVFAAWGLPFTVLIDAAGREIGRVTGSARWDDKTFIAWLRQRASA
jgi:thiol-disulfide isomerase/thioredoxin